LVLVPKSLSLVLKSAVVLFPLLAGSFLTFLGGERLYEANTVQVKRWTTPFGLLAFSSTSLDLFDPTKESIRIYINLDMRSAYTNVLQGIVDCDVFLEFRLPSYDSQGITEEDIVVGVQFPFRVVNLRNFQLTRMEPSIGQIEMPIKDVNVSTIVEENDIVNSVFYLEFIRPQTTEPQDISLHFGFEWEDIIHREGFSTFTFSFPIALGLMGGSPEFAHPYTQNPNAHYVYYAETLGLIVVMNFPFDYEVKQTFPEIEMINSPTGSTSRNFFWDVNIPEEDTLFTATQLFSVNFEEKRLSEARNSLMFDSGLYMGLGVSLIFGGIHEAVRVVAELRKK
jgi:hypothetical protein